MVRNRTEGGGLIERGKHGNVRLRKKIGRVKLARINFPPSAPIAGSGRLYPATAVTSVRAIRRRLLAEWQRRLG
jgi:hypothetical protein